MICYVGRMTGRTGKARSARGRRLRRGVGLPSASVTGMPPVIRYGPSLVTMIAGPAWAGRQGGRPLI